MTLRAVNLNLVPVLQALLKHRGVSAAAADLGMSQSAASACLAQLRDILGDPLLVKVGRRMRLTPRAEALGPEVDGVCASLGDMFVADRFDPAATTRRFVIATPDYMALLLATEVGRLLAEEAPSAAVQFVDVPPDLQTQLASGAVDLALVATDRLDWDGYVEGRSVLDDYVMVVRADHPLARSERPALAETLSCLKAGFHPGLGHPMRAWSVLPQDDSAPQLLTQQFTLLPLFALETAAVAIAPRSLARRLVAHLKLKILELPWESRTIRASLIWSPLWNTEAGHRWFRGQLDRVLTHFGSANPTA